jgi:DNA-binding IclR family transcriptional regulator
VRKTLRKRILCILRRTRRKLTATELSQRLKASPASVSSVCCRMWNAGELCRYPGCGDSHRGMGYFV